MEASFDFRPQSLQMVRRTAIITNNLLHNIIYLQQHHHYTQHTTQVCSWTNSRLRTVTPGDGSSGTTGFPGIACLANGTFQVRCSAYGTNEEKILKFCGTFKTLYEAQKHETEHALGRYAWLEKKYGFKVSERIEHVERECVFFSRASEQVIINFSN